MNKKQNKSWQESFYTKVKTPKLFLNTPKTIPKYVWNPDVV